MYLSVIVPTYNRERMLCNAIDSIINQSLSKDNYEILVIDNNSSDDTKNIVNKYVKETSNLKYLFEPIPGLLSGRHKGAKEAKGNILVFTDDDVIADNDWLKAIAETFKDTSVKIVGGRNLPIFETEPPGWINNIWQKKKDGNSYCGHLSLLDLQDKCKIIDISFVWGLNLSIRKETLLLLNGFHPDAYPWELRQYRGDGETGLGYKAKILGINAIYQPKALIYHYIPKDRMTIEYFKKRSYLQGISNSYTKIREQVGIFDNENIMKVFNIKKNIQKMKYIIRQILYSKSSDQYIKIKIIENKAYQSGYEYHRREVMQKPELLEWVLKKDYWDYKLPK